jgi:hypothetical protein
MQIYILMCILTLFQLCYLIFLYFVLFFQIFQRGRKEEKFIDQKFEELRLEWRSAYKELKAIEKSLSAFTKPDHSIVFIR